MFTVILKDKKYSWNKMEFVFDTLRDATNMAEDLFHHYSEENKHDILVMVKMEPLVYDYVEDDLANVISEEDDE